jgi:iron-sulfur cluster assembly accessory protein
MEVDQVVPLSSQKSPREASTNHGGGKKAAPSFMVDVQGSIFVLLLTMTAAAPSFKIGNEKLIKVLPNAANRLLGLLKKQGRAENGALRVAVVGGGCSGLQYKMDLVDGPANRDIMVTSSEVRVVIDPKSALFVSGSELDYSDDLQSGGFKVKNPNAVVTCSCGESFSA